MRKTFERCHTLCKYQLSSFRFPGKPCYKNLCSKGSGSDFCHIITKPYTDSQPHWGKVPLKLLLEKCVTQEMPQGQ